MNTQATEMPYDRANSMAVLARATLLELEQAWQALSLGQKPKVILPAQAGLVMVRGKAGGTGQVFNLGEMTMTRAVVELCGQQGQAYVAGRQLRLAELAACFDALLQARPEFNLLTTLISRLDERQRREKKLASCKAQGTKVDFFTMVRGENAK